MRALACNSWSCPHCRQQKAANLLDRLCRGLASRPNHYRGLVTATLDPSQFGAVCIGKSYYTKNGKPFAGQVSPETLDKITETGTLKERNMWSAPTEEQYKAAYRAMSKEFNRLMARLRTYAKRRDLDRWSYLRSVELHRNGWPHYHIVLEHPTVPDQSGGDR